MYAIKLDTHATDDTMPHYINCEYRYFRWVKMIPYRNWCWNWGQSDVFWSPFKSNSMVKWPTYFAAFTVKPYSRWSAKFCCVPLFVTFKGWARVALLVQYYFDNMWLIFEFISLKKMGFVPLVVSYTHREDQKSTWCLRPICTCFAVYINNNVTFI